MTSSGAAPGAAAPSTDGDLDHLLERALKADLLCLDILAAELFCRAEALACQSHDDTSLVPAFLRDRRMSSLRNQASASGVKVAQKIALYAEAWKLQLINVSVIERRAAAGTLVRLSS